MSAHEMHDWLVSRGYAVEIVDETHLRATRNSKAYRYEWHPTILSGYWRRERGR